MQAEDNENHEPTNSGKAAAPVEIRPAREAALNN
jgi:hypothetical protein